MKRRLTAPARQDIAAILDHSHARFGATTRQRYERVISRALRAITAADDPLLSRALPEAGPDVRLYHLRHARRPSGSAGVRRPRHVVVYRRAAADLVIVLRVLHEAMDLPSHLQEEP